MKTEVLIPLLVDLIIRLLPTFEEIASGNINLEDIDWNHYLKEDNFLERFEKIKAEKESLRDE